MGFYKWEKKNGVQDTGTDKVPGESSVDEVNDLDIEKKWLQLVKIDQEQFSYFFGKYHDRIFKYVFLRTGDHDLAAELTGEVFTLAWRRIGRFSWQGYSFGAWLFQIARGVISHGMRTRERRRETEFVPDKHGGVTQVAQETDDLTDGDRQLVRMCVTKLPAVMQDVFVLHYWMGMPVDKVALVMKIPAGTVCSHLHRGRKTLAGWLREQGIEGGLSPTGSRIVADQVREDSGLRVVDGNVETGSEE